MEEKEQKILEKVFEEYTGYWDVDVALQYAPMLFPFIEPEQKVRDSLKAINCELPAPKGAGVSRLTADSSQCPIT